MRSLRTVSLTIATALFAASCGGTVLPAPTTPDPLAGQYIVNGGGGALDNVRALTDAFGKMHPAITWQGLADVGSPAGVNLVVSGETDLGYISRDLTDAEKLAGKVGLSPRPCLERVRRLEAARIITGYQAQIALEKLSKPITVFAEIALESHGRHDQFERRLAAIEEVVECWEVSGAFDYVARVVCPDVASYEALTAALIDDPKLGISRIVSLIALRPVRPFAGYPTALLGRKPA